MSLFGWMLFESMLTWIKIYILEMSQFREILQRLRQQGQNLVSYWKKTPTTKIILINTGLYVPNWST